MTKLLIPNLQPGAQYYVQLRQVERDQQSEWSYKQNVTTQNDTSIPKAPTGVSWTSTGRSFIATWTAPTQTTDNAPLYNLDKYQVRITHVASSTSVVYDTKATRFDFTYEQNQAAFGTAKSPLTFEVRAITSTPNNSAWTTAVVGTNPVPTAVTLTATGGKEFVELKWNDTGDLDIVQFNIYASQTDGFTPGTGNRIATVNSLAYVFNTTTTGVWYFRVGAVDIFGQQTNSAQQSATVTPVITIDTTAPQWASGKMSNSTTSYSTTEYSSIVTANWTLSNDDGANANDVRAYVVRYAVNGTTNYSYFEVPAGLTTGSFLADAGSRYNVAVAPIDRSGNRAAFQDAPNNPITAAADTSTPGTPQTLPSGNVVGNTLQVQVTPTDLDTTPTAFPANVVGYQVFAGTSAGFTANTASMIGYISRGQTAGVASSVFDLPATDSTTTWYIKIKAVGRNGIAGTASAATSVVVGLIANANIANATITSAKINDLAVNKLTAGTGVIVDLKIGNATQAGSLSSFDYVAGTTGWKIGGTAAGANVLEINSGLVKASAVELRNSPNIMPPKWTDFEFRPSTYTLTGAYGSTITISSGETTAFANTQVLKVAATNASNGFELGDSNTDYGTPVEAGKTYIVSFYAKAASGTPSVSYQMRYNNGTTGSAVSSGTIGTSWTRVSRTLTIPAGLSSLRWVLYSQTNGSTIYYDGFQIEEKVGASSTPNTWSAPSSTTIDGGQIKTGSIQSTATTTVNGIDLPLWFIDMAGGAQFTSAKVLGELVVGGANIAGSGEDTTDTSLIRSQNYVQGSLGWQIDASGDAEFGNAIIRGESALVQATVSGTIKVADGGRFQSGIDNDARLVIDSHGISAFSRVVTGTGPTDFYIKQIVDINVENGSATINGDLTATSLQVLDRLAIRGNNNEISRGANLNLAAATSKPQSNPQVSVDYRKRTARGLWNAGNIMYVGGRWYVPDRFYGTGKVRILDELSDGALYLQDSDTTKFNPLNIATNSTNTPNGVADPFSIASDTNGGTTYLYTLCHAPVSSSDLRRWRINRYVLSAGGTSTSIDGWSYIQLPSINTPKMYSSGGGGLIYIAQIDHTDSNKLKFHRFSGHQTMTSGFSLGVEAVWSSTITGFSSTTSISSLQFTTADLPGPRWVVTTSFSEAAYVFGNTSSLVVQLNEMFPTGTTDATRSMWYDGSRWVVYDSAAGQVRYLSGHYWTDGGWNNTRTWWHSFSWWDSVGTQHETQVSTPIKITMRKRQSPTLSFPEIPATDSNDPNNSVTGVRAYFNISNSSATVAPAISTFKRAASDLPTGAAGEVLVKEYFTNPGTQMDVSGTAANTGVPAGFDASTPGYINDGSLGYWRGTGETSWNEVYHAAGSATQTITATTASPTALTGLSVTFTCPGPEAEYHVIYTANTQVTSGTQAVLLRQSFNGGAATNAQQLVTGAGTQTIRIPGSAQQRLTGLAAGSYTLSLAAGNTASGVTSTVYGAFCNLHVRRVR